MRIDAYNAVNQIYNTKKTKNITNTTATVATDNVEISSFGQSFQIAKKALSEASDIREDLVADVKKRYDDGAYDVDDEQFADMLIEKYFGTDK